MNKKLINKILEKLKTEQAEQLNKNGNLNADQQSNGNASSVTSAEQNSATAAENMANPTSAGTNNTVAQTTTTRTYNLGNSNFVDIQTFYSPRFGEPGVWVYNNDAYAGRKDGYFYYSTCSIAVAALAQAYNVNLSAILNAKLRIQMIEATGPNVALFANVSQNIIATAGSDNQLVELNVADIYNPSTGLVEFLVAPNGINVQNYIGFTAASMSIVYDTIFEGIEVTTPPNKTFYLVGEDFVPTGMVVKKIFSDGNSEEITDGLQFKRTGLSNEDVNFKISYGGKDTYLNLSLVQKFTYTHPTSQEQAMDIYVPVGLAENVTVPAVITIHGGNWCFGERSHYNYMTEFLTKDCGCVHVNMDYRLMQYEKDSNGEAILVNGFPIFTNNTINYRHMLADINGVISYIKAKSAEYHIDKDKIALMGWSAGGHLALLYAYMSAEGATVIDPDDETKNIEFHDVQLVISEAGPIQFATNENELVYADNYICAMAGISMPNINIDGESVYNEKLAVLAAVSPYCVAQDITDKSKLPYTILAYGFLPNDNEELTDDSVVPIEPALNLYDLINNISISSTIEYGTSGCLCPSANDNCVLYYLFNVGHGEFGGDSEGNANKVNPKIINYTSFTNYAQDNIFCTNCINTNIEENCNFCTTKRENFIISCNNVDLDEIKNYYLLLRNSLYSLKTENQ